MLMPHNRPLSPFAQQIELRLVTNEKGHSVCEIDIQQKHFNVNGTVHGGVIYSLADVGMGAALYSLMGKDERCTTIEMKINYFNAPVTGTLSCETLVVHRGRKIASMESEVRNEGRLVAKALGSFYITTADNGYAGAGGSPNSSQG